MWSPLYTFNIAVHFCFFLILLFPPCIAAEEGKTYSRLELFDVYEEIIHNDLPFDPRDVEITDFRCRPDEFSLPKGHLDYRYDLGPMTGRFGLRTFTLEILVDKQLVKQVKLIGTVQLYGEVLTAAKHLKRGHLLAAEDFHASRRNITKLGSDLVHDPTLIVGKQLKTTLKPGSILFQSLITEPLAVKRGDLVVIVADSPTLHIRVPGKAGSSGVIGDVIRVKNMMSRREIYAQIINNDEVRVEF